MVSGMARLLCCSAWQGRSPPEAGPPFRPAERSARPRSLHAARLGWWPGEMSIRRRTRARALSDAASTLEISWTEPLQVFPHQHCNGPYVGTNHIGAVSYTHLRAHETDSY